MTARTSARAVAVALAASLALAGCSGGDDDDKTATAAPTPTPTSMVDLPDGVTLTAPGTRLPIGKPATVGYPVRKVASAITVTVASVKRGRIDDLGAYALGTSAATSTPYYVHVTLRNDGPDPLNGLAVPVYGFDTTPAYFPPTRFAGRPFKRCPGGALPKKFGPRAVWKGCFVYLVPKGKRLTAMQVRTRDLPQPVSWPVR
jgi:hypothetical protein